MLKTFRLIRVELLWWYRMTLSPTRNYTNCIFPRLTLHACTLIRTISLSYCGISLSFHAISLNYALFHLSCPVSIEQLFLNGQFTRRTITFRNLPTENIMKGNEQSQSLFLFCFLIHIHLPCCRQVQIFCDYKHDSKHSATVPNKIRPPPQ